MKHILIVDDELDLRELLKYNLKNAGFEVSTAENGNVAIDIAKNRKPDLVLLDLMMPGMDGIEVCEILRSTKGLEHTIICMLTARSEDYSQIAGLDAGADDYIAKPIKPKVLVSKINSLLRRGKSVKDSPATTNERLIVDRDKYKVILDGKDLHLPKKEFELLALLASRPGSVFERDVILESVWGSEIVVGDRTIDVHVRKLREKIGDNFIKTIKGVGYKLVVD